MKTGKLNLKNAERNCHFVRTPVEYSTGWYDSGNRFVRWQRLVYQLGSFIDEAHHKLLHKSAVIYHLFVLLHCYTLSHQNSPDWFLLLSFPFRNLYTISLDSFFSSTCYPHYLFAIVLCKLIYYICSLHCWPIFRRSYIRLPYFVIAWLMLSIGLDIELKNITKGVFFLLSSWLSNQKQ